ncbi:MAG: hypothetical protein OEY59_11265 [Deltaproteobacteria bacterium]|nr:hypothetical protein [Deltaproteobacteria bacterium]
MKSRSEFTITNTAGLEEVNLSKTISNHLQKSIRQFNSSLNLMFIDFLLEREIWGKSKHLNISVSGTSTHMGSFNELPPES